MNERTIHRTGAGLLASLLAASGAIVAASWIFARVHQRLGQNQPHPEPGSISPSQHHQSPPGR